MPARTIRTSIVVTVAAAVALTACGGGVSGTTATTTAAPTTSAAAGSGLNATGYTSGVCQAMTAWVNDLQAGSTAIATQVAGASSLDEAKQDFVSYADEQVQRTQDLITSIDELGAPDVDQGAEAHQAIMDLLGQVKSVFEGAKTDAEQLPTTDLNSFLDGVTKLTDNITSGMSDIGDPFAGLSAPELEQAGNENPDCQTLGAGS